MLTPVRLAMAVMLGLAIWALVLGAWMTALVFAAISLVMWMDDEVF